MAKVRIFDAFKEGFRLIRREPKAVLVWSLVSFLLLSVPMMLITKPTASSPLGQMMPLTWLCLIAYYALVGGAVLRAVLTPQDRGRYFLRLSRAEAWMILSGVVGAVIVGIALFLLIVAVVIAVVAPFIMSRGNEAGSGLALMLLPLVPLAAVLPFCLYLMLRFYMGPVMSFDEKRFRLFESWALTRGQGWRLVGLDLLMWAFLITFDLLLFVFLAVLGGPNILAAFNGATEAMAMTENMVAFYDSPKAWLYHAACALFAGPSMAILIAPWARAYQMLRETPAAA